jgi:LacI family transcriptional regulator
MRRHLEVGSAAKVIVVVGSLSYHCHEDRETGFVLSCARSLKALKSWRLLKARTPTKPPMMPSENCCERSRILPVTYNVAGGNRGLAEALAELQRAHRPVYITHELNRVTEPLLRTQQIDCLIVQDLNEIVRRATQFMREIPSDDYQSYELEGIPFRLLTQFNLR